MWGLFALICSPVRASHHCVVNDQRSVQCHNLGVRVGVLPSTEIDFVKFDSDRDALYPLLHGGIGNQLFQLETQLRLAQRTFRPLVVGYFDHLNKDLRLFGVWGNHPHPFRGATWCDYLEQIECIAPGDYYSVRAEPLNNDFSYTEGAFDGTLELPTHVPSGPYFLQGYFFHNMYWQPLWTPSSLPALQFKQEIKDYVIAMYGELLSLETTVSVHLRLGYAAEPCVGLLDERVHPPLSFWADALQLAAKSANVTIGELQILLFSDSDEESARRFWTDVTGQSSSEHVIFVDEDPLISLHLMSCCRQHVIDCSTYSFWGAYLDTTHGRTYVHRNFFVNHGEAMIPKDSASWWIILN